MSDRKSDEYRREIGLPPLSASPDSVSGQLAEQEVESIPTKTGYYWFFEDGQDPERPEIVWFAAPSQSVFHCGEDETEPIAEMYGQWVGPISFAECAVVVAAKEVRAANGLYEDLEPAAAKSWLTFVDAVDALLSARNEANSV